VTLNSLYYDLLRGPYEQAEADLERLKGELPAKYFVSVKGFLGFTYERQFDWTQDPEYVLTKTIVDNYRQKVATARRYDTWSQGTQGDLIENRKRYQNTSDQSGDLIDQKRARYNELSSTVNNQYEVLKELGRFAVRVMVESRGASAAEGFTDSRGLGSDLSSYSAMYTLLEPGEIARNEESASFQVEAGNVSFIRSSLSEIHYILCYVHTWPWF
jgi:hypothetical protein